MCHHLDVSARARVPLRASSAAALLGLRVLVTAVSDDPRVPKEVTRFTWIFFVFFLYFLVGCLRLYRTVCLQTRPNDWSPKVENSEAARCIWLVDIGFTGVSRFD